MAYKKLITNLESKKEIIKPLRIAGGITLAMILLFGVIGSFMNDFGAGIDQQASQGQQWLIDAFEAQRSSMLLTDSIRSLVFILLASIAIWMYIKGKFKSSLLYISLGALIFFDVAGVGKRYLNAENFETERKASLQFAANNANLSINQDPNKPFRVFNTTVNSFNDAITSFHHHSVGGYSSTKLDRYQKLIERHLSQGNISVYSMLNTKYFIATGQNGQPMAQLNPDYAGHAWFVSTIKWVENDSSELANLASFNPKQEAFVNQSYRPQASALTKPIENITTTELTALGAIELTSYAPNEMIYSSSSPESQFAVFSEIFYDTDGGWQAYIDGEKSDHFRVNYLLRGIVVPPGRHEVKFVFEPKTYFSTEKTSMAFMGLLALVVLGSLFLAWRESLD